LIDAAGPVFVFLRFDRRHINESRLFQGFPIAAFAGR
jgi:hypothetical protein